MGTKEKGDTKSRKSESARRYWIVALPRSIDRTYVNVNTGESRYEQVRKVTTMEANSVPLSR
jgi:hypothetical protein